MITFTVKIRYHKDLDVADELYNASLDLADDTLNFRLKGIKCAHDKQDPMALMTYNTLSKSTQVGYQTRRSTRLTMSTSSPQQFHQPRRKQCRR